MPGIERCENCGAALLAGICPQCGERESTRLFHRDVVLLIALAAISAGVFLFTRAMAAKERALNQQVAALWYADGQRQLSGGDTRGAVDSFRKATASDYENRVYELALANALAARNHTEEARYALLRLRESAPENAEVNLDLARLAAKEGNVAEASRFYHNALYGLWTGNQVDREQREVRTELIRFLLAHQQRSAALSELIILEAGLPDEAGTQTEAAQLFLQAGDALHALRNFARASQLDKNDATALAGAGEAAFQVGDYVQAQRYLDAAQDAHAPEPDPDLLPLTNMIVSSDPLAPHLPPEERNQRLKLGFEQALRRLDACIAQVNGSTQSNAGPNNAAANAASNGTSNINGSTNGDELEQLRAEAASMQKKLAPAKSARAAEELEGVELIGKIEEAARVSCGEPTGLDRALLLLARKYKTAMQGTQQ